MFRVRLLAGGWPLWLGNREGRPRVRRNEEDYKGAEFFSHTNDDDKDHDTGVWVKVVTRKCRYGDRRLASWLKGTGSRRDCGTLSLPFQRDNRPITRIGSDPILTRSLI